jgi:pimeloyl-ACP methyl ester carboxylesterase
MTLAKAARRSTGSRLAEATRVRRLNGVELQYTDSEAGRNAVILLHGGMGDLEAWPHQIGALSPRWRVIAYSRRHSHPNRNNDAPRTVAANGLDDDIDDFLALQEALDAGPAHLVATSYGALLALGIALCAPDRVSSLVLAEPPLHRWALATDDGARLYRAFIDGVWHPAAQAFGRGEQRQAMALLTEGMWGRPTNRVVARRTHRWRDAQCPGPARADANSRSIPGLRSRRRVTVGNTHLAAARRTHECAAPTRGR